MFDGRQSNESIYAGKVDYGYDNVSASPIVGDSPLKYRDLYAENISENQDVEVLIGKTNASISTSVISQTETATLTACSSIVVAGVTR
jgi:hypothetical protein